jgi:hypothetical protein
MDEKTEELRDIFMDVSEEGTVTEEQAEGHGSLTDIDEDTVDDRLVDVIEDMRERYDFETDLGDETYCAIVRGFYEGRDDELLASQLDLDPETVFIARMDLHLVSEEDADAPLSMASLRDALSGDDPETDDLVAELDADDGVIARYRRIAAAQNAARRASHRYQSAFEDALADTNLSVQLTADVQGYGLGNATEDIESKISF